MVFVNNIDTINIVFTKTMSDTISRITEQERTCEMLACPHQHGHIFQGCMAYINAYIDIRMKQLYAKLKELIDAIRNDNNGPWNYIILKDITNTRKQYKVFIKNAILHSAPMDEDIEIVDPDEGEEDEGGIAPSPIPDPVTPQPQDPEYYIIEFHRGEDSDEQVEKYQFRYGTRLQLPTLAQLGWTRRGFDFCGWAPTEDRACSCGVAWEDGAYVTSPTNPDTTLPMYAAWALKPEFYAIKYFKNDGNGTWRTTSAPCGTNVNLDTIADMGWEREGYTFGGWATSQENVDNDQPEWQDGQLVKDIASDGRVAELYAIWRRN